MIPADGNNSAPKLSADEALRLLFPDLSLLGELERITLAAAGRIKGTLAGKRRSVTLGGSQEFADYRPYAPGDDVRRIDWSVYGRTGRAYVRQYWDEQELHLRLYVDISRSMSFGGMEANKLTYAFRLAACIGYSALCGDDRVSAALFSDRIEKEASPLHGRASSPKWFQFLAEALGQASAETAHQINLSTASLDMSAPFRAPGSMPRRAGTAWIITDGMYERGIEDAILALQAAKQQVVLCQLLSPEELDPDLSGELRLIDSELNTGKEIAVGHRLLADYRSAVAEHRAGLRRICQERGASYAFVNTGRSMKETISRMLLGTNMLASKG